ncbi:MAG: hypothetical protein KC656_12610 [Myxococcales bacterium]|nr:hypothetical protein [Myxococcales bacterium]
MALPRRGTRELTIDDLHIRWLVRVEGPDYKLVAEAFDEPGQRLVVHVPRSLFPPEVPAFTPAIARQCVLLAMSAGFDACARRGEHRLRIQPGQLDFGRVDTTEIAKRPVGRPRKRAPGENRAPIYVNLEPEDRLRLQRVAAAEGIGLGTLARRWLVERLDADGAE